MSAAGQLLRVAAGFHQAGALDDAERLYARVIESAPDLPQALWLAAVAARQNGRPERACALSARLAAVAPGHDGLYALAGAAWQDRGRADRAIRAYRRGLSLAPGDAALLTNLGLALTSHGHRAGALACQRRAAATAPGRTDVRLNLAGALRDTGRRGEAVRALVQAVALLPGDAAAWTRLGESRSAGRRFGAAVRALRIALALAPGSIGAHRALGRLDLARDGPGAAAAGSLRRAAALAPDSPAIVVDLVVAAGAALGVEDRAALLGRAVRRDPRLGVAYANLAAVEREAERPGAAIVAARRAIALDLADSLAWANLASALQDQRHHDAALAALRRALALDPTVARRQGNLAMMLLSMERLGAARAAMDRALALDPGDDGSRFNASFLYFKSGRLAEGYRLYEAGLSGGRAGLRHPRLPRWHGEPLAGRRLLVEAEQGLGDEIRFASCYADLLRLGGRCLIEADPRLVTLLRRSFPAAVVRPRDPAAPPPADADLWIPAGSLPAVFRPTFESFPREAGFLSPDPERVRLWRDRLAALPGALRVGVAWRSRRMRIAQLAYFTTLEMWRPVFAVPGVSFVNLQYDRAAPEIAAARDGLGTVIHDWPEVDLMNDLETAMALAASVDLAITVGTTVNDELGAVGTECWVLWPGTLGELGRRDHPYYPRHRLLTRRHDEPASVSLARAADLLRRRVAGTG